ncbi:GH36 C-terminal domain-containing protein [Microtetraspora malaysiensis]|uniref:GH36 C-terminal domain-containing protein n=1 Tax=Microtetraspora malaysiensis TaxID=161358 RepID=UPI000A8CCDE0|nr:GH36 C-terminal domain-containing protein [Microtetraspora malaysiensis]
MAWSTQYVAGDRVVVLAWRLSSRFGAPPVPLRLRTLDPDARYRDDDTGTIHHGAVLLAHGLPLELPGAGHGSALVRLTRVP